MDSKEELKALLKKQKSLIKTSAIVSQRLSEVQLKINELLIKQIEFKSKEVAIENDIMTEDEVCKFIGKSKATLYRMRTYHNFPHSKIPGQKAILYSRKDIMQYIKENKKK